MTGPRCGDCKIAKQVLISYKGDTFCMSCWPKYYPWPDLQRQLVDWLRQWAPDGMLASEAEAAKWSK